MKFTLELVLIFPKTLGITAVQEILLVFVFSTAVLGIGGIEEQPPRMFLAVTKRDPAVTIFPAESNIGIGITLSDDKGTDAGDAGATVDEGTEATASEAEVTQVPTSEEAMVVMDTEDEIAVEMIGWVDGLGESSGVDEGGGVGERSNCDRASQMCLETGSSVSC